MWFLEIFPVLLYGGSVVWYSLPMEVAIDPHYRYIQKIRQIHRPIGDCVFGPFPKVAHPLHEKAPKTALCAKETKKNRKPFGFRLFLVEVTGFEPATFWSRTKRATKLRYTSKKTGANEGTRTPGLLITNQLLYRLSYIGISAKFIIANVPSFVQYFFQTATVLPCQSTDCMVYYQGMRHPALQNRLPHGDVSKWS